MGFLNVEVVEKKNLGVIFGLGGRQTGPTLAGSGQVRKGLGADDWAGGDGGDKRGVPGRFHGLG